MGNWKKITKNNAFSLFKLETILHSQNKNRMLLKRNNQGHLVGLVG